MLLARGIHKARLAHPGYSAYLLRTMDESLSPIGPPNFLRERVLGASAESEASTACRMLARDIQSRSDHSPALSHLR
jgi:hypothetical protein